MFTDAQMQTYDAIRSGTFPGVAGTIPADAEWQPPRVAFAGDFPALADADAEFHDAPLLLVGYQDEDLRECECGRSHIAYVPIRSDGLLGPSLTSNTYGEAEVTSEVDPISVMLGMVDVNNIEPIFPTWDAAREVQPDEWPIGEAAQPTVTDMEDFEQVLRDENRL